MSQNHSNDILVQIEDYINQVWPSDGFLPLKGNVATYMKLHTLIYNYYMCHREPGIRNSMDANGAKLYDHIESFLQKKVHNIYHNVNGMTDRDVLRFYELYWYDHKRISKFVNSIYHFLNKEWVQYELLAGRTDIYKINVLVEQIWEKIFFKPLFPRIKQTCLNLIKINLNNHSFNDAQSIKNILLVYLDTDFIKARKEDLQCDSIDEFYIRCFENEFLQEVQDFYHQQEIIPFEPSQIFEYLTSIGKYFDYEIQSAKSYLPEQKMTLKKLIEILGETFVPDEIFNIVLKEIKSLVLNETKHQELTKLHEPINCILKIKNELIKFIEDYVYQTVSSLLCFDRKIYIETILNIHNTFCQLVREIFSDQQDLINALNRICGEFINDTTTKSSELLARYFCRSEIDFDEKLNQILIILNYVENEDFIRNFYQEIFPEHLNTSKLLHFYTNRWANLKISHQDNRIFIISMEILKKVLFQPLNEQITHACLDLIKSERNNQIINTHLINELVQSYLALEDTTNNNNQMTIYKEFFEIQFLQDTEQFYRLEAATFLRHHSVTEYLKKVAQRLDEEVHRVQSYLHSSTLSTLIKKVEEVLIRDQLDVIYMESKIFLRAERYRDLALLYKLVCRVPNATNVLKIIVANHVYEVGINAIERVSETAINNSKIYIDTILDVHRKLLTLIQEVFNNEQDFITAVDKACGKFINNNSVTDPAGISITKSSKLLARYCDALLRKENKTNEEIDLEEKFNKIMIVFNYIEDKDVFLTYYQKRLATRLVGQLSASDDYEKSFISKLKQTCGSEYTLKLEQMLQDVDKSKNLIMEYKKYYEILDFSVMVLSSNSWPFSASSNFVLPPIELKSTFDSFTEFYTHRHNGRKLTWLHQHSKGELKTLFTSPKHILQVSTYQMIGLLLFNHDLILTVEQIHDKTQIESELLFQILYSLLKNKILVCAEINDNCEQVIINMTHKIELAIDFKSQKSRINFDVPLKSIEQNDVKNFDRIINVDRIMMIQALIVRIMRSQRTLKYTLLMQKVIEELNKRFRPHISIIKKCIDIVIEKEYLERDLNDRDLLRYRV